MRIIYGLRTLEEYLKARPEAIDVIYALQSQQKHRIIHDAQKVAIPIQYESEAFLKTMTLGGNHQGIVARAHPFTYSSLSDLIQRAGDCILVLDEVMDPQNLGALLRTAETANVSGVILTKRRSAHISSSVEKAAAGATAYLSICRVGNLRQSLIALKRANYWVTGLSPKAHQTVYSMDMRGKIAFILGGEGKGIRPLIQETCDYLVSIPMAGKIGSLNVSVSGAIVLYERLRQCGVK